MAVNSVIAFDPKFIEEIDIDDSEIKLQAGKFTDKDSISKHTSSAWLATSIKCVDLAALVGNETPNDISKLCQQAASPLEGIADCDTSKLLQRNSIKCAAVCVYPLRITNAVSALINIKADKDVCVAAVAAGFPSGQYPLATRLSEIHYAVAAGAREIDVVIDRSLVLRGLWYDLYKELIYMRGACSQTPLKVILSVTECGTWTNVYKASYVAMCAGADFIKTSSGKEAKATTIHEGLVMCRAIKDFYDKTGVKVGLKPAGGIRTADHAISWMTMVQQMLGDEWVHPNLFRIGTSGTSTMIPDVAKALIKLV